MLHRLIKEKYILCMLLIGILGSFLFLVIGYWISGAVGFVQSEDMSFINGLNRVFDAPFAPYFNNYTPVIMALAFIIFEFLFYLFILHNRKNERKQEKQGTEEDTVNSLEDTDEKNMPADTVGFPDIHVNDSLKDNLNSEHMSELEIVFPMEKSPEMQTSNEKDSTDISISQEEPAIQEAVFSDDIAMELLGEYDMEQIKAMLKLTQYIDHVSADMLKRMFRQSMSAQDIREYIEIFYE